MRLSLAPTGAIVKEPEAWGVFEMIIRDTQFEVLRDEREQKRVGELAAHLCAHFPDAVKDLSEEALRQKVRQGQARAREYGLSSSTDQARFLGLAATFGWEFDREETWVAEVLSDTTFEPGERLRRVASRYQRRLETAARNASARESFGLEP